MKRTPRLIACVIGAVILSAGVAVAAPQLTSSSPSARPAAKPRAVTTVTVDAGITTTTSPRPPSMGGGGLRKISIPYHWYTGTFPGYCNVAGEYMETDWDNPGATLPSFVNGGGSQTMYTSILVYIDGGATVPGSKIRKRCGSAPAAIPDPPTPPQIAEAFKGSAELQVAIAVTPDGSPDRPGLTGLATEFSARAAPVTVSHTFAGGWVVTLHATPQRYAWNFDDPGCADSAFGPKVTFTYCSTHVHNLAVDTTWDASVDVSGPVTINAATTGPVVSETVRPYYVMQVRGYLVGEDSSTNG